MLTVSGINFVASSVIRWNGSNCLTTHISSKQLTAVVPAGAIAATGTAAITVFNPSPIAETSNAVSFSIINPIPMISALNPTSWKFDMDDFTLTVNGSGFIPGSVILWNGSKRATTFVGNSQLSTILTAGDIAFTRTAQILVFNPSPGGGTSNPMSISIGMVESDWRFLGAPNVGGMADPTVVEIDVDQEDPRILYVNAQKGLFVSHDQGISWSLAVSAKHPGSLGMIAQDPLSVDRIFYGQANNLHTSTDRGITWNLASTIEPSSYFVSLVVSRLNSHTIYAGMGGSMFYRSPDDGVTWQAYPYGPSVGEHNFAPYTLAEDPIDGTLYLGGEFGEAHPHPVEPFLRSMDGGATWENVAGTDLTGQTAFLGMATQIAIDPESHQIWVLPEGGPIYTSTDHCSTWRRAKNWYLHEAFLKDPNQTGRFFGGLSDSGDHTRGGAFISTHGAAEIFYKFGMEGYSVSNLALSGDSSYLFAASYGSGIYVTPLSPTIEAIQPSSIVSYSDQQKSRISGIKQRKEKYGSGKSRSNRTKTLWQILEH